MGTVGSGNGRVNSFGHELSPMDHGDDAGRDVDHGWMAWRMDGTGHRSTSSQPVTSLRRRRPLMNVITRGKRETKSLVGNFGLAGAKLGGAHTYFTTKPRPAHGRTPLPGCLYAIFLCWKRT